MTIEGADEFIPQPETYGPDMFYSDITVPNPATVLNEPLPRAWSEGGLIESVKRAVVTGIRDAFQMSSLSIGNDQQQFYIDIEYPTDVTNYPGIWVQFAIEQLSRAGVAMGTWTKVDDEWGEIQEWQFSGRITLTIAALTSKDRDRLADTVIAQLAYSRPPDLVIRDIHKDAKQYRGLLTTLEENPYVSMSLNTDQIASGGQTVTSGVPWGPNILLYEDNYSVNCIGQFNARMRYDGVFSLAEIVQRAVFMGDNVPYNPVQWRGKPPPR